VQAIALWIAGAVAVTALVSGSTDAVALAGKAMNITGVTAGAIVGGAPQLFSGFRDAKDAAQKPAKKAPATSNPAG